MVIEGKVYAMKRLVVVLGGLLALPAFAEVAPFFYDDVAEYADMEWVDDGVVVDDEIVAEESKVAAPVVQPQAVMRAGTNARATSRASASDASVARSATGRAVASRGTTARTTTNVTRGTATRPSVSRAAAQSTGTVRTRRTSAGNAANVARAATVGGTQKLYNANDTTIRTVSSRSSSNSASMARSPSISVSSTTTTKANAATVADIASEMDSLAELTDYCKAQYMACMDNFCNVLDDNQGRCSCSKNLKNYEKTETALKTATEELQEVAQKIQYIGLTADEISTLFTQTEAELAMQNNTDSTKLKNDLDRIKNLIVDVKTGSASAVGDTSGISLDLSNLLSFNISSTGFDLSALFGTGSANTSSVSNQRGETLYKTASARCKTAVLNSCSAQGVDAAVISNAYDMEIDKQCIVYERALSDANTQMVATVRNAKTVLQKARLMVAQQKNQYDLRGCISALDSCMQDDFVCGTDYEECLDPTGKFIVDGAVVEGSMPGMSGGSWGSNGNSLSADKGLYVVWNKDGTGSNIWAPADNNTYTMSKYINETLSLANAKDSSASDMSVFLQNKIGYHDDGNGRNYGMCISVLNKCQDYTYKDGKYLADKNNSVIVNYMARALRQIKASQDNILANYASTCISDVASCLSQNNYNAYDSTGSSNPSDMAIRACLPIINTCRSVTLGLAATDVTGLDLSNIYKWLDSSLQYKYEETCTKSGGTWSSITGDCDCSNAAGKTLVAHECVASGS